MAVWICIYLSEGSLASQVEEVGNRGGGAGHDAWAEAEEAVMCRG